MAEAWGDEITWENSLVARGINQTVAAPEGTEIDAEPLPGLGSQRIHSEAVDVRLEDRLALP